MLSLCCHHWPCTFCAGLVDFFQSVAGKSLWFFSLQHLKIVAEIPLCLATQSQVLLKTLFKLKPVLIDQLHHTFHKSRCEYSTFCWNTWKCFYTILCIIELWIVYVLCTMYRELFKEIPSCWKLANHQKSILTYYHYSDTMWSGLNADRCYGSSKGGKIITKLEVLSF